ncbi:hypothetical protein NGM36_22495, partial [Streptomyces mutabilis]|nr:hypothetical protein [Streptomyces mutabilis]
GTAGPAVCSCSCAWLIVVSFSRLLDDVADKHPVFTYPRARVRTRYGPAEAGPYYTRDNDLSVSVTALEP